MPTRCRLCSCNDRDALVDEIAKGAWNGAGYGTKWDETFPHWRASFRHHADLMLQVLERDHVHR